MPPDPDKRAFRELKRTIKKRGNKHRRAELKRVLRVNPLDAAAAPESFGRHSTAGMNGRDNPHPPPAG